MRTQGLEEGAVTNFPARIPPVVDAEDLQSYLAGSWRLSRQLQDRATGTTGQFDGAVSFTRNDSGLLHFESGVLAWGGHGHVPATRQLSWLPTSCPWAADVRFEDGRPFHHLDLSSGMDRPIHDCQPDVYRGHFQLLGPDEWKYQWEVAGPRKDLLLVSRLVRNP
ncbi:MAG TPA: DUF6314 family protein [Arthrobacter sp.]|nr:DUF6314 family protein [Arthrobacter sp.]